MTNDINYPTIERSSDDRLSQTHAQLLDAIARRCAMTAPKRPPKNQPPLLPATAASEGARGEVPMAPPSEPPPPQPTQDVEGETQREKQADDAEQAGDADMGDTHPDDASEAPCKPAPELSRSGIAPPPQGLVSSPPTAMPRQGVCLSGMSGPTVDISANDEGEAEDAAYDPKQCSIQGERIRSLSLRFIGLTSCPTEWRDQSLRSLSMK